MKPKRIFSIAVRLLGLVFLYHGLQALPTAMIQFWSSVSSASAGGVFVSFTIVAWPLLVAYWLLRGAPLPMRTAYPKPDKNSEDEEDVAAIGQKSNTGKIIVGVLIGVTVLAAGLVNSGGCSPSPTTAAVKTAVESDFMSGTPVSAVRIGVYTPTPMRTLPSLTGPWPSTGPTFSDEHGASFPCPTFQYGDGAKLAYHISVPAWRGPTTNLIFTVLFPADQLPSDKQEIYLDARISVASLAPLPVHVRVK